LFARLERVTELTEGPECMATLTIVTIARNNLDGLQRTFASLAKQTCPDVEHLVIDGGSTDGTPEWARANAVFADTTVVSEPDRGIYDAMNKGLRQAGGELVCFLNSGDCFAAPDVVEFVLDSYRKDRWEWALGLGQMVDEHFVPIRRPQQPQYSWLRQTYWHYEICHQATFMRTELVRDLGGFDERFSIAADYHLLTKAGRRVRPTMWPRMLAYTLEGGVSDRRLDAAHREAHQARADALRLRQPLLLADLLWTGVLMAKSRSRRLLRTLLRAYARRQAARRAAEPDCS
jgi:glycosyltransferase involved in cell wall biosynthesis